MSAADLIARLERADAGNAHGLTPTLAAQEVADWLREESERRQALSEGNYSDVARSAYAYSANAFDSLYRDLRSELLRG